MTADARQWPKDNVGAKQRVKSKKRKMRKLYLVVAIIALFGTLGSVFSIVGYSAEYHGDMSLAQEGIRHLRTGVTLLEALPRNSLDASAVQKAGNEFTAGLSIFVKLNEDLKSLPALSTSIPHYGTQLRAALHVLPIAIEASKVGVIACNTLNLLVSRLHTPLETQQHGLTLTDFTTINQSFQQIRMTLNLVNQQVNHLQPSDLQLDPRLTKIIAMFRKDMPILQLWLDEAAKILPVAPALLGVGTPANYLIEVLDSTELRPGGGYIGNYGIATFSGGRLTGAHITDSNLLDRPNGVTSKIIPYPAAYTWFDLAPQSWSFRDSNLDADFPTVARYAEYTYAQEGGKVPVQGVIAITPALIQHLLLITGPIAVPEYHETITAENLIARIHFHQLGGTAAGEGSSYIPSPDGNSSERKRFVALLAQHFLTHVRQLSSSALPKFYQLIISSLHSKDLQIYLNSSVAEDFLQQYHFDAAIQASAGDNLLVVDANISPSKANSFIINTLKDQVTIDAQGNALHQTTISYAWTLSGPVYGNSLYRDYVRVYVPRGSTLQVQSGWQPRGTSEAFGHEVWAGFFTLSKGQNLAITLKWTAHDVAKKDSHGWHYQYVIQRQAGAQRKFNLQVVLPSCAVVNNKQGGLVSSNNKRATLNQLLTVDLNLEIDYTC